MIRSVHLCKIHHTLTTKTVLQLTHTYTHCKTNRSNPENRFSGRHIAARARLFLENLLPNLNNYIYRKRFFSSPLGSVFSSLTFECSWAWHLVETANNSQSCLFPPPAVACPHYFVEDFSENLCRRRKDFRHSDQPKSSPSSSWSWCCVVPLRILSAVNIVY